MRRPDLPGALVMSLDFELHWGMRDRGPLSDALRDDLLRSRDLVTKIADELCARSVRATWATVGFLFASTRDELEAFSPALRPRYQRPGLDPYTEAVGIDEDADPLHLAGSVVRRLSETAGQEVGSHSFSHYYCLEPGQDEAAWRADLASAQAIARHSGIEVSSLVLARNQWNPAYAKAVSESGFSCYRGLQRSWGYTLRTDGGSTLPRRAARLADTYVGISAPPTTSWDEVDSGGGLYDVPASAFLRPYAQSLRRLERLRASRLASGLTVAARSSRIFHLWWHPHNFSRRPVESFDILRRVLDVFSNLAEKEGMLSLAMRDVPAALNAPSV